MQNPSQVFGSTRPAFGRPDPAPQWLLHLAQAAPESPVITHVRGADGSERVVSAAEWDRRARGVAAWLLQRGSKGDRVLLAHGPGPELLVGLFGCFYAGMVAVPAYPPKRTRHGVRLDSVLADCGARLALADGPGAASLRKVAETEGPWAGLELLDQEDGGLPAPLEAAQVAHPGPDEVAYLQYTSGSTADPKGVMVTFGSLTHNLELMRNAFEGGPGMVMVSWLPLFHDMGLVLGALLPLYCDGRCVLMAPNEFVQRPRLWLESLSAHRGTHSAAPDFAYRLCCDKLRDENLEGLDLSAWKVAVNGAEPVRAETLRRFCALFGPKGFRSGAIRPSYGLAEATLYVSHGTWNGDLEEPVSCGQASEQTVKVVDPESLSPCPEGTVGEIWIQGPSVCAGYWRQPELSDRVFRARAAGLEGGFLRTGDLGRFQRGQLKVHGRLKDLIILRGVNHYPEDLEEASRLATGNAAGAAAAFSLETPEGERLVLVQEISKASRGAAAAIAGRIAETLAQDHGVEAERIIVVGPGQVPRTSSGKVQRRACKRDWLDGALRVWHTLEAFSAAAAVERPAPGLNAEGPLDSLRLAEQMALSARRRAAAADEATDEGALSPPSNDWVPGVERARPVSGGHAGTGALKSAPVPAQVLWRERAHPALASLWTSVSQMQDSSAYHIAWSLRLHRALDLDGLRRDLAGLVHAQPMLGASFKLDEDGRLWAEGHGAVPVLEEPYEGRSLGLEEARAWLKDWNARPLDPAQAPLWRAAYLRLEEGGALLAFSVQHLIFDQRSWQAFHEQLQGSTRPAGPPAPLAYQAPSQTRLESCREHWRRTLAQARVTRLVTRPSGVGARLTATVPESAVAGLRNAAARHRATVFVAMAAAWADALAQVGGSDQALFAVPMTLREQPLSDPRLGYYVQPMPLLLGRCGADLGPALARADQALRDAGRQRAVSLGEALRMGGLAGVESFLVYQGSMAFEPRIQGQACVVEAIDSGAIKAPVALEISGDGRWDLVLTYDQGLGEDKALRLLNAFQRRIEQWGGAESASVAQSAVLKCEGALPDTCRTVIDGFHRQVGIRAGSVALSWDGGQMDYGELAERVRSVARALDQAGVSSGQRVAVMASPGPDWVAAMLGCFEAGAVYVPVDPAYPVERQQAMLQAAPCVLALVEGPPSASLAGYPVLDLSAAVHARPPYLRTPGHPAPTDPAYVIFTSGSSGRPKGVQVSHGALVNHALGYAGRLGLKPEDRVMQFVSISFDPSLEELLPALLSGSAVVLSRRRGALAVQELEGLALGQRVSVLHLPAAYWHAWMGAGGDAALRRLPDLRAVVTGGEAPDPRMVEALLGATQGRCQFFNAYGPTEACITVSLFACQDPRDVPARLPLGKPMPGMALAVLGPDGRPVQGEGEGELWISGPQLADCHWIDGRQDEGAFTWAALEEGETRRWYRSGDRVRWAAGSGLLHLGRMDRQLKVSGHRLDPEEVESLLMELPGVAQAAVDARKRGDGEVELLAWVQAQPGQALNLAGLRERLARQLSPACLPRRVIEVAALPLTPNGKLDRPALWDGLQDGGAAPGVAPPEAPTGVPDAMLAGLCQAWSQCLGKADLGPDADFFEQGGSSLTAVRLSAEAGRVCGQAVSVEQVMQTASPRRLLQALRGAVESRPRLWQPLAGHGPARWVLFPPVSGRLDCYRDLAQHLGTDATVVGLDLAALEPDGAGRWAFWVERCVEAVLREAPGGPLALGGWSMGGLLAADVARALGKRGRKVERLVLIDSLVPDPVESALVLDDPSALDPVFDRDLAAFGGLEPGHAGLSEATELWRRRFKDHAVALTSFQPRPLNVPVTLAVSERSARERAHASWMAWALLAQAGMTTLLLPGDHFAVLGAGSARRLAGRMNRDAWKKLDEGAAVLAGISGERMP